MRTIATIVAALAMSVTAPPAVTLETLHYASTIDPALTDLRARVAMPAPSGDGRQPVIVLMHGFRLDASSFADATYRRLAASASAIVIGVEMRGRGGASGAPDGGGREIHDIADAVAALEARDPARVAPDRVHLLGYSGGGANVISAAGRFPDRFASVTAFFPIADYGYDRTLGWFWQASTAQRRDLERWIGPQPGTPAYASRAPVFAIGNFRGPIRLFHDREDTNVPAAHSVALAEAARTSERRVELSVSAATDPVRWKHEGPNGEAPVIQAEPRFLPDVANPAVVAAALPRRGRLAIAGYLVSRPFSVWLGEGTAARGQVDYDLEAKRFDLTFETGEAPWRVVLHGQTPGARVAIAVNGRRFDVSADRAGDATVPAAAPHPE